MSLPNEQIEKILKEVPPTPGVYFFKDETGVILYIGKALRLRNRVRSYFYPKSNSSHYASQVLKDKVGSIDWMVTNSEAEALILEANLVRKHKPKYNVLLKDDKHFPYLKVTVGESFPRILVTRKILRDGAEYFGPYTEAGAMRRTLKLLYKWFQIRDCHIELPPHTWQRPCLTYHMGRCPAPCAFDGLKDQYRLGVTGALRFLRGERKELVQHLELQMKNKVQSQEFEAAARIRDQMHDIEAMLEKQRVDLGDDLTAKDVIGLARHGNLGVVVVVEIRQGIVISKKNFSLRVPPDTSDEQILGELLEPLYALAIELPSEIIMPHEIPEKEWHEEWMLARQGSAVHISVPQRGEKKRLLEIAEQNAKMQLGRKALEAQNRGDGQENQAKLAGPQEALKELAAVLELKELPMRIEGYDISHLHGTGTVASQVVFMEGRPSNKDYRHYQIKTVSGIDDFASMREVIGRRLKHADEKGWELPDLFVIDGGKGQLSAAVQILKDHEVVRPILGLAKREEEIFLPGFSKSIQLSLRSPALKLLQSIRNESHRFALKLQRKQRKSSVTVSALEDVPGIGKAVAKKLLQNYGSLLRVKSAPPEELYTLIGKKRTETLLAHFKLLV